MARTSMAMITADTRCLVFLLFKLNIVLYLPEITGVLSQSLSV